jgi:hypothetical protein
MNLKALVLASLLTALSGPGTSGQAPPPHTQAKQDSSDRPAITATYAFGEVISINPAEKQVVIKTVEGNVSASFDDKTQFKSVPPGAESLEGAQTITLADVSVGDIMMARGRVSEDKKTVLARQFIVMNKTAIAEKQNRERERWRTHGVAGRVTAIDRQARELTLSLRTPAGERPVTIALPSGVILRRYAPDSIRFADAVPSSLEELKVGDQVRARGEKSQDGTRVVAEEIVSGSFHVLGGPILSVDPSKAEIVVNDVVTKKPVTVFINANSTLRKVPAEVVASMAQKSAQGGGGGGTTPTASGNGQGDGARRQVNSTDLLEVFDRLPPLTVGELKPGPMVLISSTAGADPSRVTAILLATGLDPLFVRPQAAGGQRAPVGAVGLPGGVFDGFIGAP